jgi:beta-propeller repeat-containing protein
MKSMIKTLALVSVLLAGMSTVSAGPNVTALPWTSQFGTAGHDCAIGVAAEGTGIYVAGTVTASLIDECLDTDGVGQDAFVRRYNTGGSLVWTRVFGTSAVDVAFGVAADAAGNAYVTGDTYGVLGQSAAGGDDAFVRKYDLVGNVLWTDQFGSALDDHAGDVAVDEDGNAYVVGFTEGALPGQRSHGSRDAFVRKYDSVGNVVWTRQFGSLQADGAAGVDLDATGNAYLAGFTLGYLAALNDGTSDGYVRAYDTSGNVLWTSQFGDADHIGAVDIAVGGDGSASITGLVGPTNDSEVFLRRYGTGGGLLWTRHFGTVQGEYVRGVAMDSAGNALVVGETWGTLGQISKGGQDAFVRSYNAAGDVLWTKQFGTGSDDLALSVAADDAGNPLVAGSTNGTFVGQSSAGGEDAFLAKIVIPSFILQPLNDVLVPVLIDFLGPY